MKAEEIRSKMQAKGLNKTALFEDAGIETAKGHRWLSEKATLEPYQLRKLEQSLKRLHRSITF